MKLSVTEKVGFAAGDMAINIVMISMQLIIAFFYTDVYGLDPVHMGILFMVVRLIDAISDPLMGMFTDTERKHGHYRPFLLWFAIPFGVAVYLTFITPDFEYAGKLIWAYGSYIFLTLMFTAVTIPYISLIGVITLDPAERLSANGYRFVFVKIAAFLVTIVVPAIALSVGDGDRAAGYQTAMGLMGILGTILLIICFKTTKERVKPTIEKINIKEQFKHLFKNDQWVILCIVLTFIMCGFVIRGSVATYYAKYYLGGGDAMISPLLTTGVVASLLAMIASTWITKYYDKVNLFKYSQIATFVLSVAMYLLVGQSEVVLAFVFTFMIWFAADLYAPIFWASIAEVVDYGAYKTGKRVSGLAFGGISFFQKFGMGIAGGLIGVLLSFFNYKADVVQSEFTLHGLSLMMTIIPATFHLLVGLVMTKFVINNKYYLEIVDKLKNRDRLEVRENA